MSVRNILQELRDNINVIVAYDTPLAKSLWKELLDLHPADIARLLSDINQEHVAKLFERLPEKIKLEVFEELPDYLKVYSLEAMDENDRVLALNALPPDELTDLFDLLTDEELKYNLNLLHKQAREKVLSLMQFDPESAGGIMDTQALSLMQDLTVEKAIKLLQRLSPTREIYQQIYVTDRAHHLVGFIKLEDLVLQQPTNTISSFIRQNELVAQADEDQEKIAKEMVHYGLMTIPVVGDNNIFLGVIPGETLVDVLVEEAGEDLQKMSALAPTKHTYFEMPFIRVFYERGYILVILLLAESILTSIQQANEATLHYGSLAFFTTTLVSVGGNASNQTSTLVIQGLASGSLRTANLWRFFRREILMAFSLAGIIALTGFGRAYFATGSITESIIVSLTLGTIVTISVSFGTCLPLILRRIGIDPAFSAGPFLATIMDIIGVFTYCTIAKFVLFR